MVVSPTAVNAETAEYQDGIQMNNINSIETSTTNASDINPEFNQITPPQGITTVQSSSTVSNDISSLTEEQRQEYLKTLPQDDIFILDNIKYSKGSSGVTVEGMTVNSIYMLVIPDMVGGLMVTTVKERAFENKPIHILQLGNNILDVGQYSFSKSAIKQLTLGNRLMAVGDYAFEGNAFTQLSMPNSLTSLGKGSFSNGSLSELSLSVALRTIGPYAFANNQLKVLQLPQTIIVIEEYAFANNQLTSLTFRQGLLSLGTMSFSNNRITNVYVPSSVKVMGDYVYLNNPVTSVTMPERMKNYLSQITSNPMSLSSLLLYEEGKDPGSGTTSPTTPNNTGNKVTDSTILGMSVRQGSFGVVQPKFNGNSFGTFELSKSELQKQIGFSSDVYVVDTTGSGKGWSLTVQATQFTEVVPSSGGKAPKGGWLKLPQGSLKLTGVGSPYKVNVDGSTKPVESGLKVTNTESVIDNVPVSLVTADRTSSFGTFGLDLSKASLILNLDPTTVLVDSENYPNSPTPYTTTITWTLTAGPGN